MTTTELIHHRIGAHHRFIVERHAPDRYMRAGLMYGKTPRGDWAITCTIGRVEIGWYRT